MYLSRYRYSISELEEATEAVLPKQALPFSEINREGLIGLGRKSEKGVCYCSTPIFSDLYTFILNPLLAGSPTALTSIDTNKKIDDNLSILLSNQMLEIEYLEETLVTIKRNWYRKIISREERIVPYIIKANLKDKPNLEVWQVLDTELLYPLYEQDYQRIKDTMEKYER